MALTIVFTIFVAVLVAAFLRTIYRGLTSPLRKVPGPWYASFTGLPGAWATLQKRQIQYVHRLHQIYGPIVHVAPDHVAIADLATFKEIHRIGSGFCKTDLYHHLTPSEGAKPPYGLFQMTDPKDHASRRKLLARGFTVNSLRETWEPIVMEKVQGSIDGMELEAKRSGKNEVDIRKWWLLMASDVVSHVMFGQSFGGIQSGKEDPYFEAIKDATAGSMMAYNLPWVHMVARYIPLPSIQKMFTAQHKLLEKGRMAIENSTSTAGTQNIFARVLEASDSDSGTLDDDDICVEAGSFMVAGTDTTSNTLTYIVWAVLQDKALQQMLESEVIGIEPPLTDAALEQLPILNAVILESLRLYGAAPGGLPRVVPQPGRQLAGHFIPGNVTVSTQAWTLHRNPEIFPDPLRFDHTRWLEGGPATTSATAKAAYTPFGAGGRVCIGRHLAMMELRLAVAVFFRQCRGASVSSSTTEDDMEMDNLFLIEPRGGTCKIVLHTA